MDPNPAPSLLSACSLLWEQWPCLACVSEHGADRFPGSPAEAPACGAGLPAAEGGGSGAGAPPEAALLGLPGGADILALQGTHTVAHGTPQPFGAFLSVTCQNQSRSCWEEGPWVGHLLKVRPGGGSCVLLSRGP